VQPTKRPGAQRKSAQVIRAMMGTDNITCPSKAPVAGSAVGVPASVRTRGFGQQLAAARCELRSGIQIAWVARQRRWHGGMRVVDCPGERRCARTACTVWEGAGGDAPMMPSPMWIAGWHIGGAPLAYLITHGAPPLWRRAARMRRGGPGEPARHGEARCPSRGRCVDAVGAR
jgi:hypothetical protein